MIPVPQALAVKVGHEELETVYSWVSGGGEFVGAVDVLLMVIPTLRS